MPDNVRQHLMRLARQMIPDSSRCCWGVVSLEDSVEGWMEDGNDCTAMLLQLCSAACRLAALSVCFTFICVPQPAVLLEDS